jgi:uncharacterized membrane protein
MHNRFNRPFGPEHVEALISKLREAATARQESDPQLADALYKSLHMIATLWRECSLHDELTRTAEQVLDTTEAKLKECLEKQSVEHAAHALAEVARLKGVIKDPPERHESAEEQQKG